MKTSVYFCPEDQLQLHSVLNHTAPGPKPTEDQRSILKEVLAKASKLSVNEEATSWVGLGDKVSLVSPKDSSDYFNLTIVLPGEANPDMDLVSVLLPISLATIGRRCGENVSWETPRGLREMRIVSVIKAESVLA